MPYWENTVLTLYNGIREDVALGLSIDPTMNSFVLVDFAERNESAQKKKSTGKYKYGEMVYNWPDKKRVYLNRKDIKTLRHALYNYLKSNNLDNSVVIDKNRSIQGVFTKVQLSLSVSNDGKLMLEYIEPENKYKIYFVFQDVSVVKDFYLFIDDAYKHEFLYKTMGSLIKTLFEAQNQENVNTKSSGVQSKVENKRKASVKNQPNKQSQPKPELDPDAFPENESLDFEDF